MARLSRRQRLLRLTAAAGLLLALVAAGAVWLDLRAGPVHRPGEQIEGLTDELARSLPADHPTVSFRDVTRAAGITFRHFSGTRSSQIAEDMGSGAAWGDYDNDGWLDLFVVNEVGPLTLSDADRRRSPARSVLYHNNGDGTFHDVTDQSGIDQSGWGMAAAWGDYDHDGWIDLLVTAYGENLLYHNNGDGSFTDRSQRSGIGGRRGFWTGAAWGDYDRDGFLDLYITGYVNLEKQGHPAGASQYDVENPASINPSSFPPERNLLYHNNRDGSFTERAAAAGVLDPAGRGLAASWCDFDEDGWPDLYVANDVSDNAMFRNLGNGRFADVSHAARVADYRSSMGIAVGDWDGDGDQDMVLTHWLAQENALYTNRLRELAAAAPAGVPPALQFSDEADRYGLGQIALDFVGWGTSFFDYDNDGKLDLLVVNGSTLQQRSDPSRLVPMRHQLFWNRGRPQGFYDVSVAAGPFFQQPTVGRGAAFADYDNDGDVDVFIVSHDAPATLLRNEGGNHAHWLQVQLRGTRSNTQGIGAKLRLVAGGVAQLRQVGAQASYLSQNALIEGFGLGTQLRADTLEVVWPSGVRQLRTAIPADRRVLVVENDSTPDHPEPGSAPITEAVRRERISEFWTRFRAATALRIAGRARDAAEAYARALELNPRHEDALYYLGSLQFELGGFAAAERAWQQLVVVSPASARAHSQLGTLYLCLDAGAPFDPMRAAAEFRLAHQLNKEETGPLLHLAEAALLRGDFGGAGTYLTAVLGANAASTAAHFYRGYVAWKTGAPEAAAQAFARAVATSSPPKPVLPPGASSEGDTKGRATASGTAPGRCGALRDLANNLGGLQSTTLTREMAARYRALDSLIVQGRRRGR